MFIISWILIRVLTALALALALAVAALVAATASARGIGLAIAVWFVLPPGMLVGWLGVIAAYTAASDYGLMMIQRRSAERRAQVPGIGGEGGAMHAIHYVMRREAARRNQQILTEQAALG